MGATPGPSTRLHLVRAGELDQNTAQTPGMRRSAALTGATVGSAAIWMGQATAEPRSRTADHHHGESESGIYVVAGHPVFVFLDGDREVRLEAGPGDYVYVPPYVPHREENPTDAEAVVVLARSTQEAIVVNLESLSGGPLAE